MSACPPILVIAFNRPQHVQRLVDVLQTVQPANVFLAVDGPRPNCPEDVRRCAEVKGILGNSSFARVQHLRFSETNLGCGLGPATAIEWFFTAVEQGIILEDDCIPHPDFFPFCGELLQRYTADERVFQISGSAPYPVRPATASYHFSKTFRCHGWATWRRAWRHFDHGLTRWPALKQHAALRGWFASEPEYQLWVRRLDRIHAAAKSHVWDAQWNAACFLQHALCAVPERNLVSNVGFGADATHTFDAASPFAAVPTAGLDFPLTHPPFVVPDDRPEAALRQERCQHAGRLGSWRVAVRDRLIGWADRIGGEVGLA